MLSIPGCALAADFSARIHHHRQTGENPPPEEGDSIIVKGNWVRIVTSRRGKKIVRIHRPDLNVTFDVYPEEKSYKEFPYMGEEQWFAWYSRFKPMLKAAGHEKIGSEMCNKFIAPNSAIFWISPRLDFPLRITLGSFFIELSDIKTGAIDDTLFAPPHEYRLTFSFLKNKAIPLARTKTGAIVYERQSSLQSPRPGKEKQADVVPDTALESEDTPFYDFPLKMFVFPGNNGKVSKLNQPIVIRFNHPVQPSFFSFAVNPDPGGWRTVWGKNRQTVELYHSKPFTSSERYIVTAKVVGGPCQKVSFTTMAMSPYRQLEQDLAESRIDINQAATYRLLRVMDPSRVPKRYRPCTPTKCGTSDFRRVAHEFNKLNRKTRNKLLPYLLPPTNPKSFWRRKSFKNGVIHKKHAAFKLVQPAYADMPWYSARYHTDTGFDIVIMGAPHERKTIIQARDLLQEKKIYEKLERLMGRKTPDAGDHKLMIFIYDSFPGKDAGIYGACNFDPTSASDGKNAAPWIAISSQMCCTKRLLGATLAHEIFHAFQYALTPDFEDWIGEGTAVWAEDYISRDWNTEQEYTSDAFNVLLHELTQLEATGENDIYERYLFPIYLTKVSPGDSKIIREIWENMEAGKDAIEAVRAAVANFDHVWKKIRSGRA